jgi:hypothetical protein
MPAGKLKDKIGEKKIFNEESCRVRSLIGSISEMCGSPTLVSGQQHQVVSVGRNRKIYVFFRRKSVSDPNLFVSAVHGSAIKSVQIRNPEYKCFLQKKHCKHQKVNNGSVEKSTYLLWVT